MKKAAIIYDQPVDEERLEKDGFTRVKNVIPKKGLMFLVAKFFTQPKYYQIITITITKKVGSKFQVLIRSNNYDWSGFIANQPIPSRGTLNIFFDHERESGYSIIDYGFIFLLKK